MVPAGVEQKISQPEGESIEAEMPETSPAEAREPLLPDVAGHSGDEGGSERLPCNRPRRTLTQGKRKAPVTTACHICDHVYGLPENVSRSARGQLAYTSFPPCCASRPPLVTGFGFFSPAVCPFILANEFCERLAYYGLATNLVVYLTDVMGMETSGTSPRARFFHHVPKVGGIFAYYR